MAKQNKFGTFGGVFVPSILTILGVIMYLRLPTIIGEAGLWATIGIIIVAHIISVTTGLSVSSIATDKKVEAGGTYYMISRSLGLPIGGTLGIALFMGLSFSVSLYLIGFSESFLNTFDWEITKNNIRLVGSITLIIVTIITFISTSLALKTQYFILGLIVLSLISIFMGFGNHTHVAESPLFTNPTSTIPLMTLFGIFFPAVTGFEAGVSMSGDLKDPKKSIPGGSIMAIAVGFTVYIILAFFLSYTVDAGFLNNTDGKAPMVEIARIKELVIAGIWGATLSSALGSILGAPRILQATAIDKITPSFLGKGSEKSNEPRNALLLTFALAEIGILIGELDVIARIVSIFFITTYGFLNISAAFEKLTSTDFRPEFKVSHWISIVGAIACIIVMILLDFVALLGATVLLFALFFYLKNKELSLESGDAWSGVWATLVKKGLTKLTKNKLHNRNWRPNIIMFSGNPNTRKYMIQMGKAISGKLGVLSAFELQESDAKILVKTAANLKEEADDSGYFHYKFNCKDVYAGMDSVSRLYGFSGIEPNTILMGWSRNPRNKDQFIDLLKGFDENGYNSIFLDYNTEKKFGNQKTVDIWWTGNDRNLSLAVKIIQHLTSSEIWKVSQTRLMIINPINSEAENIYRSASALMKDFRVDADVRVINNELDPLSRKEIIAEESKTTDLVILGISDRAYSNLGDHYDDISGILDEVGSTMVINASKAFEEHEVIRFNHTSKENISTEFTDFNLPEIKLSKYPEIADDITLQQQNGAKVLELLFRKTFAQTSKDRLSAIDEIQHRVESTQKEVLKINDLNELVRRKKAVDKLKNDTFYKVNALLKNGLSDEILKAHEEKLTQGLNWYLVRLKEEIAKFPIKLVVNYQADDIKIDPSDRWGLRWNKRWMKFKKSIFGISYKQAIAYRKSAKYYQYQNRLEFLNHYLEQLLLEEVSFYEQLRNITKNLFAYFDNLEKKFDSGDENWADTSVLEQVKNEVILLRESEKSLDIIQQGRLQLEYVKNLQIMNDHLSLIDTDEITYQKLKGDKYHKELVQKASEFPALYDLKIRNTLNLILIELSVNATRNRMETIQDSFIQEITQLLERKYFKELDLLEEILTNEQELPQQEKFNASLSLNTHLKEAFDHALERMIPLIEQMPDNLKISSITQNEEGDSSVSIPVARMMEYYFKSQFQIPMEEAFEQLSESIKRSTYGVKDIINLVEISLEGNPENKNAKIESETLTDALKKIKQESQTVKEDIKQFKDISCEALGEVYSPLSSMKIEKSASEFSSGLRVYQSKQVISSLGELWQNGQLKVQKLMTKIFYSRSEGILFAKKNKHINYIQSNTSKLLTLREKVNPKKSVTAVLPHFYVTLFNGKSSIGKDYWVTRNIEEQSFKKAVKRYKEGYKGGIMVIGDRNTGKTVFIKQMAQELLKNQHVYTVFPSSQGSRSIDDFNKAIAKATQKRGEAQQILGRLPAGSTLVINDLELFWERSEGGNAVIKLLQQLINQYSHKILFILNTNPQAFKIINQENCIEPYFIEIINMMSFDAEELKDLVMKRHKSSGLGIVYHDEKVLTEVQLAHLFNKYFDYSSGNPGTALGGWLAHINKLSKGNLIINKPAFPALSIFNDLDENLQLLLTEFVYHKRLSDASIAKVMKWSEEHTNSMILSMQRSGIITEKVPGTYQIDPFLQPFLVQAFKEKGLFTK